MDIAGRWQLSIKTPIGTQEAEITLRQDTTEDFGGTFVDRGEIKEIEAPQRTGERLCWRQQVTEPLRLNLVFEVEVHGEQMQGVVKAGFLPQSQLTGRRVGK